MLRRGFCALGSVEGPLVRSLSSPPTVAALAFGQMAQLPSVGETLEGGVIVRDACAIVAADETSLLLVRGPYGGRPLYFASEHGDHVVVACTRLEALLGTLDGIPRLNMARLGALITSVTSDPSATVYEGVSRLRSCETAYFTEAGKVTSIRLPSWPDAREGSIEELASELRRRVVAAVDRCVGSFPRVAVMASGGLDSAGLVAALALRAGRISGFAADISAIDFGGPGDDRAHLAALTRLHPLQPHRLRPAEAASILPASLVIDGAPAVWPSGPPLILAATRARERGAHAVVSGWGGDVLFDGNLGQLGERARAGDWIGATLDAARLQLLWSSSPIDRVREYVARPILDDMLPGSWRASWKRMQVRRSREWKWSGGKLRSFMSLAAAPPDVDWRTDLATSTEMDEAADERGQHEVAAGIPRLDPYLDAELIEFMVTVPAHMLLHDHRMRGFYRYAMRGVLPESLRMRADKASFEPAIGQLFDSVAQDPTFQKLLRMEALSDLGMVEPRPFREALTRTLQGHSRRGWLETWPAIAVEAFVQSYRDPGPVDACASLT